jgi:hypothetical protein
MPNNNPTDNGQAWTVSRLQAHAESLHRARVRELAATIQEDFLEDLESLYLSRAAWQKSYPGVVDIAALMTELRLLFPDLSFLARPDFPSASTNILIRLWSSAENNQ